MLRHSSESVVGDYSEVLLDGCAFSKLFMGVDGIDFDFGITTTDMREAHLNQKMMQAAQKRSEEHTSELQSRQYLVCRLLLEKKTTYSPSLLRSFPLSF